MIKKKWNSFKNSKSGWLLISSVFAVSLFFLLSLAAGLLVIPLYVIKSDESTVMSVLSFVAPIVTIGMVIGASLLLFKNTKLREVLKLKMPNNKIFWMLPAVLLGYVVLLVAALAILEIINPTVAGQEQEVARTLKEVNGLSLGLMAFGVVILTPIAEELFFRGLLLSLYVKRVKFYVGIFVGAILFGLAHWQWNVSLDTVIFGVALGLLTWQTESIYPAIFLHFLKNSLALIVILN